MDIASARCKIAAYGKELYDRRLTDASGGNIGMRIGDKLLMTPRYAGALWHWNLTPNRILVLDLEGNKLEGDGEVSRETKVHVALLGAYYPHASVVMHTHARNILVFCSVGAPLPPVLQYTEPFGTIEQTRVAFSETTDLADAVMEKIQAKIAATGNHLTACMAPGHGLFVLANSLEEAFELTDRLDNNAYCIINSQKLPGGQP